jgi:phospholipid N-methyltransferase
MYVISLPCCDVHHLDQQACVEQASRIVQQYDSVFAPDPTNDDLDAWITTLIAGCGGGDLWVATMNGAPDLLIALDSERWQFVIRLLNELYPQLQRARSIMPNEISSVRAYRRVSRAQVMRYNAQFLQYKEYSGSPSSLLAPVDDDPWDFQSSPYEQRRHNAELELLEGMAPQTIVELGACVGVFSERLHRAFPRARLIAAEPSPRFVRQLAANLGRKAEIQQVTAHEMSIECDLVVASSCFYEMNIFPFRLLRSAKSVLTSHRAEYELAVVRPYMLSLGFSILREREVSPVFEDFCGFTVDKDGTLITLWNR